jgi:hypothetical protein
MNHRTMGNLGLAACACLAAVLLWWMIRGSASTPSRAQAMQGQVSRTAEVVERRDPAAGRVVVQFPMGADCSKTDIRLFSINNSTKPIKQINGSGYIEVPVGAYDVEISGVRVGVQVQPRMESLVKVGALRVSAHPKTQVTLGSLEIGLPVGEYQIKLADAVRSIRIRDNVLTEY